MIGMIGFEPIKSLIVCRLRIAFTFQGILGCDLVGFHIEDYCLNFIDCVQRGLGCRVDRKSLLADHGGRTVRIRPLPIGIPFQRFEDMAKDAPRTMNDKVQTILGVDRLDYTKVSIPVLCGSY